MVGGTEAISLGVLVARVQLSATLVNPYAGDAVRLDVTSPAGRPVDTATTGSNGTASTGRSLVLAGLDPVQVTLSQTAVSGSLGAYQDSWSCTRGGAADPSLPSGDAGGSAVVTLSLGSLVSCAITDTAVPASLSLSSTASAPVDVNADGLTDAGDTIGYSFIVANTGQSTVDSIVVNDRAAGSVTCLATTLAAAAGTTCTTDVPHTITQDDVDAGSVVNTATAQGTDSYGNLVRSSASQTTTPVQHRVTVTGALRAAVTDVNGDGRTDTGDTIQYSMSVHNAGTVTLHAPSVSSSSATVTFTCPAGPIAPGNDAACLATAAYVVTAADVAAGHVDLTATSHALDPSGATVTGPASTLSTVVSG
jgi:uncharacterized repeat protein (TIGR01451 family)